MAEQMVWRSWTCSVLSATVQQMFRANLVFEHLNHRAEHFIGNAVPPYAILSHTWATEEVEFQDIRERPLEAARLRGYRKIDYTCQQARLDGLTYAWVDTCCIDKSSSAELSESINSMYGFYERAQICFVYLSDVRGHGLLIADPDEDVLQVTSADESEPDTAHPALLDAFANSRWFTRGWCLQELIAPYHLRFYDEQWELLGHKRQLVQTLSRITGVDALVLYSQVRMSGFCTARKMYWASHRTTTRPEDRAYSLMGIFDVNMPLLYGEGEKKAFRRLQQEIIKISIDQSIFAWDESSLVANVLNCRYEDNLTGPICLRLGRLLQPEREDDEDYGNAQSQSSVVRISRPFQIHPARRRPTHFEHRYTRLIVKSIGEVLAAPVVNFTIALHDDHASHWRYLSRPRTVTFQMLLDDSIERCFEIVDAWPPTQWNPDTLVMRSTWKRDGTFWAYITLQIKSYPSVKFSVVFSCSVNSYSVYRECKLLLCIHDPPELVAAELKQRLAAADVSESPFISLKCPDEQFGIFAHCSLPYVVMDAEVQEIRVTTSTFTDIATKDEGARLDGTKAGKLGKLYGFKKNASLHIDIAQQFSRHQTSKSSSLQRNRKCTGR